MHESLACCVLSAALNYSSPGLRTGPGSGIFLVSVGTLVADRPPGRGVVLLSALSSNAVLRGRNEEFCRLIASVVAAARTECDKNALPDCSLLVTAPPPCRGRSRLWPTSSSPAASVC